LPKPVHLKEVEMRLRFGAALVFLWIIAAPPAFAQTTPTAPAATADQALRDATRESLRQLLETTGKRSDVNVEFRQATTNPYNFVGKMKDTMTNVDYLEIVISVTNQNTIGFRIFPHNKEGYFNLKKAQDGPGLMHRLLLLSDQNFLFWGADKSDDIFCGYTVTLESGFPIDALVIVLRSIRASDKFVGELRPFIDGSASAK
jgi:hypothetical protein